jgi:hypothetical protein
MKLPYHGRCHVSCFVAAGSAASHLLIQQVTSVLLAAVAALSLKNVAGGGDVPPASMAELLRSTELREQLDKRECCWGLNLSCAATEKHVLLGACLARGGNHTV